jgi:hypothetical protein
VSIIIRLRLCPALSLSKIAHFYDSIYDRGQWQELQKNGITDRRRWISENSKANRTETMEGPAESGQICSVGRRKIAKKIAKNKRCYANTLRPRSRMLLKVMKGG